MTFDNSEYKLPAELWKLAATVSVVEAALLLLDIEPQGISEYIERWADDRKPERYLAARNAITSAIQKEQLDGAMIHPTYENAVGGGIEMDYERFDYHLSHVDVASLANWLDQRGYSCSTFPAPSAHSTGFRNPDHPRYSAKLAAVVEAWESYDEESTAPGTPKQRLIIWLRLNAARFGLTGEDGKPSESVIEEIAKIANWATTGGAPRSVSEDDLPF